MALLLKLVIRGVLVCVGMALLCHDDHSAHAAQEPATDPFVEVQMGGLDPQWPENCMRNASFGGKEPTRCLYPEPIQFKEHATGPVFSFSTKFVVDLYLYDPSSWQIGYGGSATNGMEGFTFAMLPHPNASLGGHGGYLGLLNATSNSDPQLHTFAVEFDFVHNPQFSDPDGGFHLGIDVNSMNSTAWALLQGPSQIDQVWSLQVWIDYDSSTQMLNVSTANVNTFDCALSDEQRPAGPVMLQYNDTTSLPFNSLSLKIDLSDVLNEFMYVGFTSPLSPLQIYTGYTWRLWNLRTSNATGPATPSAPLYCWTFPTQSFFERQPFQVKLASLLALLLALAIIYAVAYKYYSRWVERRGWRFNIDADDLGAAEPHKFTYKELALATKNFDPKRALGRGGFGSVYKGFLPGNKQDVAVKRVAADSNQGEREFMAEVMIIGKIRHRNLVRLQGWCHEKGELLLVYDFMPLGSLDKLLFASPDVPATEELLSSSAKAQAGDVELATVDKTVVIGFPWERRFKVIVDVATALVYLHTECEERIIHRDVKAANVMLDAKFNARLGDFGLARSYNHSLLIPESTNVAGTFGYLAPELFHIGWLVCMVGKQTEQTDVYSFGAFLLEVACGKKPIYHNDGEVMLLVEHVWTMWGNSTILATVDPRLAGNYNSFEMSTVLCLGLLCSHPTATMRPSMRQVLLILNGDVPLPDIPVSRPRIGDDFPRSSPHNVSWSTNPSSYITATEALIDKKQMNYSFHMSVEDEESFITSMTVIQ